MFCMYLQRENAEIAIRRRVDDRSLWGAINVRAVGNLDDLRQGALAFYSVRSTE